ncbi:MAG: EamA family transporter [Bryobacteraceae bacterium]
MGIVFSLLAIICFTALYLVVGRSQEKHVDPYGLTVLIFLAGLVLSFLASMPFSPVQYPRQLLITGTMMGTTAGIGLFGIALSAKAGVPVSVINTVASLALAIPVLLALIFYREIPQSYQTVGLLLSLVAIVLLQGSSAGTSAPPSWGSRGSIITMLWMMLIFLGNGSAQFFQARLHLAGLDALQSSALVMMYISGAIFSTGALLVFRGRVDRRAWGYGAAVGLASYAGNFSVLRALGALPPHIVFPVVICGPIILTVLYARVFEGVRLTGRQSVGLTCGVAAVLLLTVV